MSPTEKESRIMTAEPIPDLGRSKSIVELVSSFGKSVVPVSNCGNIVTFFGKLEDLMVISII